MDYKVSYTPKNGFTKIARIGDGELKLSEFGLIMLEDGETFSARSEAVVAWTGRLPTGFCPKLSIWDILLPHGPRDLLFTFYGPSIVWIEGSVDGRPSAFNSQLANRRRAYGV